jgi:hypothetical protein
MAFEWGGDTKGTKEKKILKYKIGRKQKSLSEN